uniref:Protein E7 n=1 Tax=Human papillomavirus TaxID=10566 RepID=A0A385PL42_9PAPI|nr:MAG: E7 protein [Human papillomavirus]
MIGPNIRSGDIELDLEALVLPENLLSNESLSPDTEGQAEEVEQAPYTIDSTCHSCGARVRICVVATRRAILSLQELLTEELLLLCPSCSRSVVRNGRR